MFYALGDKFQGTFPRMDLELPPVGRPCNFVGMTRMRMTLCFILLLALQTSWGQVSKPSPEESANAAIEAVLVDFDQKDYNKALEKLGNLEKARPEDPLVLNLLGSVYSRKKDYPTAEAYFRKALSRNPAFFPAQFNLGELMFLQKQYGEARDHFQSMRASDKRNELLQFKLVLCNLELNDKEGAQKILGAIKYPGDSPAWYYAQAAWEAKAGNLKKAREYVAGARYIFGAKTSLFDESFEVMGLKLH
ncbi:MAG: tetratricopeptide repeat protein [bacterium]